MRGKIFGEIVMQKIVRLFEPVRKILFAAADFMREASAGISKTNSSIAKPEAAPVCLNF